MKALINKEFIEKAIRVHGDKYDYSKVNYVNNHTKVCIICPEHGEFYQTPHNHLSGKGCPECKTEKMKGTTDEFIKKAKQVYGDKYDYSKVVYVNNHTKVCIICPEHGEFWQSPSNHLLWCGCPECKIEKQKSTVDEFVEKARHVHGDKYDYSKVEYINAKAKVCIICPKHGEFWQKPNGHLSGKGCSKCAKCYMDRWYFIEKSIKKHNGKYNYSKVEYINAKSKVCIICHKHGEFWQSPTNHLNGQGCPKCNMSHLERDVIQFLDRHNIKYEYQKRFKWLGKMSLDFYLPDYNIAIECQGIQHYKPVDFGGKGKEWSTQLFEGVQKRDEKKRELCEEHDIKLRYYNESSY